MKLSIVLVVFTLFLAGCNKSGGSKDCSNAANCSGNKGPLIDPNTKAKVTFLQSVFYDKKLSQWRKILPVELSSGGMGESISIYSDFVSLPNAEAMKSILLADQQGEDPGLFTYNLYNKIPYISVVAKPDTTYVYNFKKINKAGSEVGGKTGSMIVSGDKAFLPFTKESFGSIFFPDDITESQSGFSYRVNIVAQPSNQKASDVYTVNFSASMIVPNRDFDVVYSQAIKDITIQNRWNYFYNGADGIANTDLELATMVETNTNPESIPLDIKVIFKTAPRMEMAYTIFDEDSIIRTTNLVETKTSHLRGNAFYEKSYVLHSDKDFLMKFKINNQTVALQNSNREAEIRDIPSGQLWKLTFGYDLTQHPSFTSGKQLLKPLKPVCNEVGQLPYYPIQESNAKKNYANIGGFLSVCHPDLFERKIVPAEEINSTTFELTDSWFWAFSYFPKQDITSGPNHLFNSAGHFYGVKNIEFRVSGCMKVLTREASPLPVNPNIYEIKNNESPECSSGPGDTGWMKYEISHVISIFDNTLLFTETLGLKELVDLYRNAVPKNSPQFYFNQDTFFEHIH